MTASLPTPDDLIALLSESVTWHTPTPEGPRATISPQWVERMAETILARLQPAFEELDTLRVWQRDAQQTIFDAGKIAGELAKDRAALRASLARKDEALRACVEALEGVALNGSHETPLWSWCDDGWTCMHPECEAARAALACAQEAER